MVRKDSNHAKYDSHIDYREASNHADPSPIADLLGVFNSELNEREDIGRDHNYYIGFVTVQIQLITLCKLGLFFCQFKALTFKEDYLCVVYLVKVKANLSVEEQVRV